MKEFEVLAWMVVLGATAGAACALVGCYLVLRRLSLLGDAISHAVLPGLVLAFLLTGRLGGWPMLLGALAMGLLTSLLTAAVHRATGVGEDAGMGVVFTSLFALGVVMLSGRRADLDVNCVLNGLLEMAADDRVLMLGVEVPRSLFTLGPVLALVVIVLVVAWKEIKLTSFDPALATALGLPAVLIHQGMLGLVAGVTVASFEAVGSILVVAMLIVPPVTAQMLTEKLHRMYLLAALVAVISAVVGVLLAYRLNTSAPGMMSVVAGGQLGLAWLFAPREGLVAGAWRSWSLTVRIAAEDVLARLYRAEQGTPAGPLPGGFVGWAARRTLSSRGDLAGGTLTEAGRARAESLVRAHRLWEAYLHSELALPAEPPPRPGGGDGTFPRRGDAGEAERGARRGEGGPARQADPRQVRPPGSPGAAAPGRAARALPSPAGVRITTPNHHTGEHAMSAEARLKELGITLPPPGRPMAKYKMAVRVGDTIYLSGHAPVKATPDTPVTGRCGQDLTLEQGRLSARRRRPEPPGYPARPARQPRQGQAASSRRSPWSTAPPTSSTTPRSSTATPS